MSSKFAVRSAAKQFRQQQQQLQLLQQKIEYMKAKNPDDTREEIIAKVKILKDDDTEFIKWLSLVMSGKGQIHPVIGKGITKRKKRRKPRKKKSVKKRKGKSKKKRVRRKRKSRRR